MCYAQKPAKATLLYALKVPILNGFPLGDTSFANTAAAWDVLPKCFFKKRRIQGLKIIYDFNRRKRGTNPTKEAAVQKYPPVAHPLVRSHPVTIANAFIWLQALA